MEYFEDVAVGHTASHGRYEVTREEIRQFAERYDPQPIHLDETAARDSMFDGLVASGWHTAAMTMRLLVDGFLDGTRALGAAGVDELRWHEPVRPGDELSVDVEVVSKDDWDDRRGLVRSRVTTLNGDGESVLTMVPLVLWARR